MAMPTQYELVSLYYQAVAAGVAPAGALDDVKAKWQAAAKKLRETANEQAFEMTAAEIEADNIQKAADGATSLDALKIIWTQELADEIAGHNRPEVIQELNDNLAL